MGHSGLQGWVNCRALKHAWHHARACVTAFRTRPHITHTIRPHAPPCRRCHATRTTHPAHYAMDLSPSTCCPTPPRVRAWRPCHSRLYLPQVNTSTWRRYFTCSCMPSFYRTPDDARTNDNAYGLQDCGRRCYCVRRCWLPHVLLAAVPFIPTACPACIATATTHCMTPAFTCPPRFPRHNHLHLALCEPFVVVAVTCCSPHPAYRYCPTTCPSPATPHLLPHSPPPRFAPIPHYHLPAYHTTTTATFARRCNLLPSLRTGNPLPFHLRTTRSTYAVPMRATYRHRCCRHHLRLSPHLQRTTPIYGTYRVLPFTWLTRRTWPVSTLSTFLLRHTTAHLPALPF